MSKGKTEEKKEKDDSGYKELFDILANRKYRVKGGKMKTKTEGMSKEQAKEILKQIEFTESESKYGNDFVVTQTFDIDTIREAIEILTQGSNQVVEDKEVRGAVEVLKDRYVETAKKHMTEYTYYFYQWGQALSVIETALSQNKENKREEG